MIIDRFADRRGAVLALSLLALCASPGLAQPAGSRADVDASIRRALAHEEAGRTVEALDEMRGAVTRSNFEDGKARYFLARMYAARRQELLAAGDARGAREAEALALNHLRGARDLGRADPADREWGQAALDRLHERARRTPLINQHVAGSYPYGYCGPTSLRMLLRLERLHDPGADAVALGGARPYEPGVGAWGQRLGQRGRELGLEGATFTTTGDWADVVRSIDDGRPALLSGSDGFRARFADTGALRARSYGAGHYLVVVGYEDGPDGRLRTLILNDPDTGRRLTMELADARRFFGRDGELWLVTYVRARPS